MKGVRLNKQTIDAATYQGKGADYRWDSELRGFALRVYPSGLKSFVVTYRVRGKQRFYTIGRYGEMTVRQARAEALEVLALARKGQDPAGDRIASRKAPTMTDLAERYIREHVRVRLKPPNDRRTELMWERHILPRLGQRKVADVDRADIAKLHSDLVATPVMAVAPTSVADFSLQPGDGSWGFVLETSGYKILNQSGSLAFYGTATYILEPEATNGIDRPGADPFEEESRPPTSTWGG